MANRTMMQMFEWNTTDDGSHWNTLKDNAKKLAEEGVNMVWLPPAYKSDGTHQVGYAVYDMYDLGEFDQKYTVRTKYGTKEEYLDMIHKMQEQGIEVLCDIVMNQRCNADETENVWATKIWKGANNTGRIEHKQIKAYTKFNFSGRNNTYSDFKWKHHHFTGVDYDDNEPVENNPFVYLFDGKSWDNEVDNENENYDFLLGCDIDLEHPEVKEELIRWGKWHYDTTHCNGFRLDAVKHMCAPFYKEWIKEMRDYAASKGEGYMFTVGEYWSSDLGKLKNYLDKVDKQFNVIKLSNLVISRSA